MKHLLVLKQYKFVIFFLSLCLIFSFWLMFHTFSYENNSILIASKAWSDFASHIPLIRSFSLGSNLPPEYPIFPGEPIRYHFLFYLVVGLLERLGMRIDFALNIPSALSFFLLICSIYLLAMLLFNRLLPLTTKKTPLNGNASGKCVSCQFINGILMGP